MTSKRDKEQLERWFDGELQDGDVDLDRLLNDAAAAGHLKLLKTLREGVEAVRTNAEIGDGQFPAFMEGIRERVHTPAPRSWRGWWAIASLTAAVLVGAISTFALISYGQKPVAADTVVEEYSTDIEGGKATSRKTESGTTIVWVDAPEKDIL